MGFPGDSVVKNPSANAGDTGSIPGSGRSARGGNGRPFQYPCLGKSMDRGVWQVTVHGHHKESDTTYRVNNNKPVKGTIDKIIPAEGQVPNPTGMLSVTEYEMVGGCRLFAPDLMPPFHLLQSWQLCFSPLPPSSCYFPPQQTPILEVLSLPKAEIRSKALT